MSNSSEVGACTINVNSYKCSIQKISVSTTWKSPTAETSDSAVVTAFHYQSEKKDKTMYLVSSPKGKMVTITTIRDEADCQRENHKKYVLSSGTETYNSTTNNKPAGLGGANSTPSGGTNQSSTKPEKKDEKREIKKGEMVNIKCYKIDGVLEAFKYFTFPIPTLKKYTTLFKYQTCKEGTFKYKFISYPDISYRIEFALGAGGIKNIGGTTRFDRKSKNLSYVSTQLSTLNSDSLDYELKLSPTLEATTTYNGGNDKLKLKINFDTSKEIARLTYSHDSVEQELGSEFLQKIPKGIQKFKDILSLMKKICTADFVKELREFDTTNLLKYKVKPFQLMMAPPNVLLCYEGKYQTSKDLSRIGRCLDFGIACAPLISISFTVDLLYLILNFISGGTYNGFLAILGNLDYVIGKLLGKDYKKKYKDTTPFSADVYFRFIITGAIEGSVHAIIDTSQKDPYTLSGSLAGELKVDLEAGAKGSINVFFVAVEAEAKGSASSGIRIVERLERHVQEQPGGLSLTAECIFKGLKIKYIVQANVAAMQTYSYGRKWDDEKSLLPEKTLFSNQWIIA